MCQFLNDIEAKMRTALVLWGTAVSTIVDEPDFDLVANVKDRAGFHTTNRLELSTSHPSREHAAGLWRRVFDGDDSSLHHPDVPLSARTLDGRIDPHFLPLGSCTLCSRTRAAPPTNQAL